MKRTSLMICTSFAALALASGGALAQSERMGPDAAGAGEGAPPAAEMAPQSGSELPGSRMDRGPGGDPALEGEMGGPIGEGNALGEGDGSAATGASEGEFGRDGSSPDEQFGRRGSEDGSGDNTMERRSGASEGASEGEAGRDDSSATHERGARRDAEGRKADRESGRDADASEGASEGAEGMDEKPSGSLTELKGEERTKVQSAFRSHRSEAVVNDIDVDINIGTSIPRSVSLYAVPQDVVVIVPEYRSYKYFIYDDHVVIVDPGTLAIIDILVLV